MKRRHRKLRRNPEKGKPRKNLFEGLQGYGAWNFNAPARHYHGVSNPLGAMDGVGPNLSNDMRLLERHIERLSTGRPLGAVVKDLLEELSRGQNGEHKR